ncbi:MAG: YciI family protein [Bradyrhizobium sp.]|nr:hypothetical protein [Burkholderiales bacterium]MBU6456331.1 YciI family protein [Bradyrhizobium sp.]MDE2157297.1 hypothetical protein [Burkholderiales bacterium]MDE2502680.1 hypothetical protein [Burkholderiales bacterium]
MEFVLTFHQPAEVYETNADPVRGAAPMQAWRQYMDAMQAAGVLRGGNRLDAFGATSVRVRDGRRQVQDGPYAETKDLLGGYVVVEVPSLDEALKWAERSPSSAVGSTEVWPVMTMAPR